MGLRFYLLHMDHSCVPTGYFRLHGWALYGGQTVAADCTLIRHATDTKQIKYNYYYLS